jgi:hypothetical protein
MYIILRPVQEFFFPLATVAIAGEWLQKLGLCSALRDFEQ